MLTAKNKKTFTVIGAVLGFVFLGFALYRAKKMTDMNQSVKFADAAKAELTKLVTA